ncbi:MAG: HEAT repeat domain-containing protein [bacterium]
MKKFFIFCFVLLLFQNSYAQEAADFFKSACASYIRGDEEKTIELLEQAVKLAPDNKEITDFYAKILTEYGSENFLAGKYGIARGFLAKAEKLQPENKQIKNMLTLCDRMSMKETSALKNGDAINVKGLITEFKDQKEKFSANYSIGMEMIGKILKESEKEKRELINLLSRQQDEDRKKLNRIVFGAVVIIILLGFLTALFMHKSMQRLAAKREDSLLAHQKHILEELSNTSSLKASLPPLFRRSTHEVITDIDPIVREKARRIELIEKELQEEKDPTAATSLLIPYLDDSNNRVRANASKALYYHNEKLATATLKNMLLSYNKWMRASAVWALGELATEKTIEIILGIRNETKKSVLKQLQKTLERLLERDEIKKAVRDEIKKLLEETNAKLPE